tara:strand:- start:364 stop:543 length:180 start_codon:yes stop_codon:yes gene_type:complete
MRELTDFEKWVVSELEKLEKQNLSLHKRAKEDAFNIKRLEELVHLIVHVVDITPHIKFK